MVAAMRDVLVRLVSPALLASIAIGCSGGDAPKAWNSLSTCLAGSAAQGDLPKRLKQLRLNQLNNSDAVSKDAWPARCSSYANDLYKASDDYPLLKRKLQEKFACVEEKASCAVSNNEAFISATTELWETAKNAGLNAEPATGVPAPAAAAEPGFNAQNWKSFADQPLNVVGPRKSADGRVRLLLRVVSAEGPGTGKPTACEFVPPALDKVKCSAAHKDVPDLPLHTVDLAESASGTYVTGLTETGLVAYDFETGTKSVVRGTGTMVQDGVAVEGGTGDNASAFLAVAIKDGKPGKDLKLPVKVPRNKPVVVGDQIVWLEQADAGNDLVADTVAGAALKPAVTIKGAFNGPFHTCQANGHLAVATWERSASQPGAKATVGADKTQFAVSDYKDGTWSKVGEATLPFERLAESELACTKSGTSMTWATRVDGNITISRLDCAAGSCKVDSAKLTGFDSKWFWAVAPMGDKVLLMWRSSLGDTRLRVAPLAALDKTKDTLLFDTQDFGGPSVPDASVLVTDGGALLMFKSDKPVALSVGADGAPKLVTKI